MNLLRTLLMIGSRNFPFRHTPRARSCTTCWPVSFFQRRSRALHPHFEQTFTYRSLRRCQLPSAKPSRRRTGILEVNVQYESHTLLIGDVSGKGMGAALLMSGLHARAHLLFEDPALSAAQVSRLNRSVAADCPGNSFITFFVAVLDPASGELVYCNAGHNAPLLLHSNGEVEPLGCTGLPLGIMRDANYEQKICRLDPGDLLVLFSDGVTEACTPDESQEFGEQRLMAVVQSRRNRTAADTIDAIKAELLSFTEGAPAADDVTLMVVRRC
jgi:serine phosphatase RsbU (regulator of sigma subunit)